MAAAAGRALRIKYDPGGGAVVIATARTDTITVNNTPIDITSKDETGIVTLLDDIGTKQVSLSVSGVASDSTIGDLAFAAAAGVALHDFEIAVAALKTYTAAFFISDFEYTGDEGDSAVMFTCSLTSSGVVTAT